MGDLPGPKIRVGQLEHEPIQLKRGQRFTLTVNKSLENTRQVSISFLNLPKVVKPGDSIYLNDGYICLEVEEIKGNEVRRRINSGGELRSRKGVNLPGIDLGIYTFTEQDQEFLKFSAQHRLDAISQSFVQDAADVEAVRRAAREMGYDPFIIAKIERARALDNLDEILTSADGIIVARGNIEVVPFQEIAIIQKDMIHKANLHGKPVITATHMLESMIEHRRPTRAEVTDVANAIIDGSDCVMLSGETSVGQYPTEAVAAMASIARYTEDKMQCRSLAAEFESYRAEGALTQEDHISLGVYRTVEALKPDMVFAMSTTGASVRRLARFRPPQWIVTISPSEKTCQELSFTYGVYPIYEPVRAERWACYVADWISQFGLKSKLVLLTEGSDTRRNRDTTLIEIIDL